MNLVPLVCFFQNGRNICCWLIFSWKYCISVFLVFEFRKSDGMGNFWWKFAVEFWLGIVFEPGSFLTLQHILLENNDESGAKAAGWIIRESNWLYSWQSWFYEFLIFTSHWLKMQVYFRLPLNFDKDLHLQQMQTYNNTQHHQHVLFIIWTMEFK